MHDDHGHFLLCAAHSDVTGPTLSIIRHLVPGASIEMIVNCDLEAETDSAFVAAWTLGTLVQYMWECRNTNSSPVTDIITGRLRANVKTLSANVILASRAELLESMIYKYLTVLS